MTPHLKAAADAFASKSAMHEAGMGSLMVKSWKMLEQDARWMTLIVLSHMVVSILSKWRN